MVELIIENHESNIRIKPNVIDGITVEWTRQGAAGKMTFTVIKDPGLAFNEGNTVTLIVDGYKMFRGFVVRKSRDKMQHIEVTCLDQLFYLAQNSTHYVAKRQKASEAIKVLAQEKGIDLGEIADTEFVIEKHRIDSATSYLDIMQTLLDLTLAYSGKMFVLYDDCTKLTLKNIEDMKLNENKEALLITKDNTENFDYESNIENSYNEVSLWQRENAGDNSTQKGRLYEAAHVYDPKNQLRWGMLTYYEELDKDITKEDAKLRARMLMELHNQVKRKLRLTGIFGDPRIRAGSAILLDMNLGDVDEPRWFMVENAQHNIKNNYHTMDLDVVSNKGFVL